MDYLLDTNIVSNLRRAKPHPNLMAWLTSVPPEAVFMSAATIAEIQCGIAKARDVPGAMDVSVSVQRWLDGMLQDGRPLIVDFDADAASVLGRMWAAPSLDGFVRNDPRSRKGKSGADLVLAASAITRGMTVVSNDLSDFLRIHDAFALPGLFAPFSLSWPVEPGAAALR